MAWISLPDFPRTRTGYDSIWVIVYSLDQSGSLYPRENHLYKCEVGQDIYLRKDRMSAWSSEDHRRGTQFTSKFWNQLHQTLGTRLEFSIAFHPQTDEQTEKVNQILEDMLRASALDYGSSWYDNFPYADFSYNNSYQASLKMAPFEALYGRRSQTLLMWDEVGDRQLFGPNVIKESEENVKLIRDRLKVAQSRQKNIADSKTQGGSL